LASAGGAAGKGGQLARDPARLAGLGGASGKAVHHAAHCSPPSFRTAHGDEISGPHPPTSADHLHTSPPPLVGAVSSAGGHRTEARPLLGADLAPDLGAHGEHPLDLLVRRPTRQREAHQRAHPRRRRLAEQGADHVATLQGPAQGHGAAERAGDERQDRGPAEAHVVGPRDRSRA
jgi:hypothetical protein